MVMKNPRPLTGNNSSLIKFHLREVTSVALERYDESLWLFGNTVDKHSVAIRVDDFRPYFYLECPADLGDVDTWMGLMNDDLRLWPNAPDVITRVDVVERVPIIGYCDNTSIKLLKVEYVNQSYIWRLRKHFDKPVHVGKNPRKLQRYHDDWGIESLFLHESGLKMQQWVEVSGYSTNHKVTSCIIERKANWKNFKWIEALSAMPPVLCCALRIRCRCQMSTKINPILPSADTSGDKVAVIAAQIYWMGDTENKWSFTFDEEDEGILLSKFEEVVNGKFDVDCFEYLSDNCDPLQYVACRKPTLRLSKFIKYGNKILRRTRDQQVYKVLHPGRSCLDIQCALKKMMIEPKLDGFRLRDAIFHPKIVRGNPNPEMAQYSYILGNFLNTCELKRQCEEEVDWMRQVEQNNSMLLGFVEISSASYTQLTVAVANGQQIRVWKKFISKFHEEKLLVNKQELRKPPVIVKKTVAESSYPDPPELPNIPFTDRKSQSQKSGKIFRNLTGDVVDLEKKKKESKTKKKYQGGYVCDPEAGFYQSLTEATFTFDFGSLYPSIMRGNDVCYMRLVYDKKYLTDDRYKKEYVPVNETECIVLIVGKVVDGVLYKSRTVVPQTISEVCEERDRVKILMKKAKDPFLYASLNAKQLGCKVFQNAVYGFLGVEEHPLLACPVLMAMVCRIGQNMIKRVRYMMLKDHEAYVVYGDTDSVMVQFPHPEELKTRDEIFGYYYDLCNKLADLGTKLFPYPNVLEFETMKWPFWLRKKKNYAAHEYNEKSWKGKPKLAIKGLPFKKRDRCPMVRRVGYQVMEYILTLQSDKIKPYLRNEMETLVRNKVPYKDLAITCLMQDESSYQSENLIQLETARNISARTGSFFEPGSRLSYVVVSGNKSLYQRGEDPDFADKNNVKLDLLYYLEKQLLSAILPLLEFHDEIDIRDDIKAVKQEIKRKSTGVVSLLSMTKKRKSPSQIPRPATVAVEITHLEPKKKKLNSLLDIPETLG